MNTKNLLAIPILLLLCSYGLSQDKKVDYNHVEAKVKLNRQFGKNRLYHDGWIDFNKNGVMDCYENSNADIEDRIADLISKMTIEEKTCQMVTLYGYRRVLKDDLPTPEWKNSLWKDGVGAIDEHLNSFKNWGLPLTTESYVWPASTHAWALNTVQEWFVEQTRLGIPVDFTDEGIRGVEAFKATNFPTQLGMGSTWDTELVKKEGRITGREARLLGYTNVYAPILDVGRDQRWGRYEEIYGEDPYLVAEMGVAMASGMQQDWQVAATGKHYCIYSANKGAREGMARVDPQISIHEVENIHMYPWREVIGRANLQGVMSSYNDYDGEPIQGSHYWLYDRLRTDFGFRGYVVSDSDAVEYLFNKHHVAQDMKEAVYQSVMAGLNVRCTFRSPDSFVLPLRELVKEGRIPMSVIDERVADVLRVKFLTGLFDKPYQTDYAAADREVNGEENNRVSLRASLESLVLLKNDGTLPLDPKSLKRIAVIGPNADETSFVHTHYGPLATEAVSVLQGIRDLAASIQNGPEIIYAQGSKLVDDNWPESEIFGYEPSDEDIRMASEAVEAAEKSDIAIIVAGGGQRTCGENKSRSSIDLPPCQDYLLRQVHKTGKPMVVVLICGRPLSINWADRNANAILCGWYPGSHGGTAIAKTLFGEYNPGGKLTVTFPRTVGQIPFNFPYKPNSQVDGYGGLGPDGKASRVGGGALYDFGHGLSYTTFEYSDIRISSKYLNRDDSLEVSFDIKNTGRMAGDEVAQLYLHDQTSSITVYEKMLRGFRRVHLEPGETKTVKMTLEPKAFEMLDRNLRRIIEPGYFDIYIGSSSTNLKLGATVVQLDPENPEKYRKETGNKGLELPVELKKGEEASIETNIDVPFGKLSFYWRADSDCDFIVEITEGGGQFFKIYQGHCSSGQMQRITSGTRKASEIRIRLLNGHGAITAIDCEAIK
ncbi:MAG: glycoside hydrolase family 3 C-terminal domain-containing protein [Bacteroidales bacterium]|nr:glycoside hydrolase family 3 C-terminal domain-containing protein [Candidatus Cacconaster equifaecalis]